MNLPGATSAWCPRAMRPGWRTPARVQSRLWRFSNVRVLGARSMVVLRVGVGAARGSGWLVRPHGRAPRGAPRQEALLVPRGSLREAAEEEARPPKGPGAEAGRSRWRARIEPAWSRARCPTLARG